MQRLARLMVLTGQQSEDVLPLLERLALEGEDEEWPDWARLTAARLADSEMNLRGAP